MKFLFSFLGAEGTQEVRSILTIYGLLCQQFNARVQERTAAQVLQCLRNQCHRRWYTGVPPGDTQASLGVNLQYLTGVWYQGLNLEHTVLSTGPPTFLYVQPISFGALQALPFIPKFILLLIIKSIFHMKYSNTTEEILSLKQQMKR